MPELSFSELQLEAAKLEMSPAFQAVCELARDLPLDVKNKDDLKTGLVTSSVSLTKALDRKAIRFDRREDEAMLYGLLAVVMEVVFEGEFKSGLKPVRVQ